MLTELGKFLRKLRIDNHQNLSEMADILGISSANLSSIENGKRKPNQSMISVIIEKYNLTKVCAVYLSPVFGKIEPADMVSYMIANNLNDIKLQIQMHKVIWDPNLRGV